MGSERDVSDARVGFVHDVTPTSVAAHELKSPLALIRQLGLELSGDQLNDFERQRIVEQIIQVSGKALRLTSDITKAEAAQTGLFPLLPTSPLDVVGEVRGELSALYRLHGKSLAVRRIRKLPPVIANRDLLRRILLNFADNALHYSDVDGMVELQGQLLAGGNTVRLSVRDYGPALPLKQWKKLADSLVAVKPAHARRPQSSGLGMHISHRFAENMNGRIGAIRHRDGASFYVELPVSRQMELL